MVKHKLVGRLGSFIGILVLGSACTAGQIGDVPGGARLGPGAGDPEIGNETAPLVCPGARPDVSVQNGWQSSEASLPADGTLRFELKARSTAANLDGIVAVGAEDIDEFAKAAISVRFADNGLVDVRDGAFYSSDLAYPYDPGVWYSIAIAADIDAQTYDVEIGPCGEPRKTLIKDALFRDNTNVSGQLSEWAVWSSQAAALEVSTPAWMNSEGCAPATCLSLGHSCGAPQDGCGGTLSCGVCGEGETCSSGACIDAPASPPPPPVCVPATCQSLGVECAQWGDGCGGIFSCGSCDGGELCSAGVCIDLPPNTPPPPACTPATCQSLGRECGQWGDGCGGALNCGGCSAGGTCSSGVCIAPPPACTPTSCQALGAECGLQSDGCGGLLSCGGCSGSESCTSGTCVDNSPPPPAPAPPPSGTPYGHVVPADVGVEIGVGVTAAVPTTVYSGPNPVTANGTVIENVVINGCLELNNVSNVTITNAIINCASWYGIYATGASNVTVVNSKIHNVTDGKAVYLDTGNSNWLISKNEVRGGQDFFFFSNNNSEITIEDNYMHSPIGNADSHSDGFQWWPDIGNGAFYIRGNYITREGSAATPNDILFTGDEPGTTYVFENNFLGLWGFYTLRYHGYGANMTIRNNVYEQAYKSELSLYGLPSAALYFDPQDGQGGGTYRCNRYQDGSFIEQQYVTSSGAPTPAHDTSGCPSYP